MRFYSVLNLKRQGFGPVTISETGLKMLQTEPKFDENYKVVGECDQAGNLLASIAQNNFITKSPEVKKPEVKKEIIGGPELQGFTDEEKQIIENGKRESERANAEARQATEESGRTGHSETEAGRGRQADDQNVAPDAREPRDPAQPGTRKRGRPKRTDTAG